MMHRFEDPWNRFASTGRIEDYLSYKRHLEAIARQSSAGGSKSDGPPMNASRSKHPALRGHPLF